MYNVIYCDDTHFRNISKSGHSIVTCNISVQWVFYIELHSFWNSNLDCNVYWNQMQLYANPLGCFGSCRLTSFVVEIVCQKKIFVEVTFFKLWICLVIPSCQTVELLKQIVESSSRALTIKLKYYSTNMFGIQTSNCGKIIVSPVPPFKMWRH